MTLAHKIASESDCYVWKTVEIAKHSSRLTILTKSYCISSFRGCVVSLRIQIELLQTWKITDLLRFFLLLTIGDKLAHRFQQVVGLMGVGSSERVQYYVHPWSRREKKGTVIIAGVNSARAACQVSSAAPSACQSSLGVASVAKLCHVYAKRSPYVCQERGGGERGEILLVLCFLILVADKTRGIKSLSVIPF